MERKEYTTGPPRLINVVDRVLVVGGGVIGLSSAYKLAQAGHGVTLVSPASGPGRRLLGGGRDVGPGHRGAIR